MAQSGGVVFAGGTFSAVRPPDAAAGSSERPVVNFVALDAATGRPASCKLSFTVGSGLATVRALTVSPDHRTLYAGGRFGAVNGVKVSNVAAIDVRTCMPKTGFKVSVNATVRALAATDDAVYLGGDFTTVAGQARRYFASVTSTSAALRPWKADADEPGRAVKVTPDGRNVILGGDFFHVNGADSHALAVLNSTNGNLTKRYPAGFLATNMTVKDITTDTTGFYAATENYSRPLGGRRLSGPIAYDGRMAFDLDGFNERWRDKCFGATQAVEVYKGVLYSASHAHDCSRMGQLPELWERQHLLAEPVNAPRLLGWFPDTNDGIGEHIGPRVLTTASKNGTAYMWVGGEFTTVNGKPQQSLTRFASGPDTTAPSAPQVSVSSTTPGRIDVRWQSSLDPDDSKLTYRVYRNGSHTPIHTVTGSSLLWIRPQLTFTDTDIATGSAYSYRITASDGTHTSHLSKPAKVTTARTANRYAQRVLADGADLYWRFEETDGTFAADSSGAGNGGIHRGASTRGIIPGAVPDSNAAVGYRGADGYTYSERPSPTPTSYSLETWFKTSTTTGGKLVGFDSRTWMMRSRRYDKHVYMTNDGRLVFGVYAGGARTISSRASFNDGKWHHVVATQGRGGMQLFVDGTLQASNPRVVTSADYAGYWHVGGGQLGGLAGWPSSPSSLCFAGQIDETAIYRSVLSAAQVAQHHSLGMPRTP
ncbi:LamG-like jellyroll fold domain-containing protein [Streptomyces sp. NPDC007205]|uniref:LamG domain-containing protein n=1 Tax=Streptomyces sp. NPDC007205 TaxID=3154316 RepID=UPI0033FCE4B0